MLSLECSSRPPHRRGPRPPRTLFHLLVAVASLFVGAAFSGGLLACSLDWTPQATVQQETDADASADAPSSVDAPVEAASDDAGYDDAEQEHDASADARDAEAFDTGIPADAAVCGAGGSCEDGSVCVYPDHYCGSGVEGRCVQKPTSCAEAGVGAVCACDSQVELSGCNAEAKGHDVSRQAACTTPSGTFRCGYRYCSTSNEACVQQGDDFSCLSLGTCVTGCLCTGAILACSGGSCSNASGHIVITCP